MLCGKYGDVSTDKHESRRQTPSISICLLLDFDMVKSKTLQILVYEGMG